jgi:hypothetical protein
LRKLDAVLAAGASHRQDLDDWARAAGPTLFIAAKEAAGRELAALDAAVSRWRPRLDALHVVVIGSHMARQGEIALSYFLRLFGEAQEGGRVIYAESLWDDASALELLATHLTDAEIAQAFFADPARLHRDILAP